MAPATAPVRPRLQRTDAWARYDCTDPDAPTGGLALCCEHASARVPPPLETSATDRGWLQTHWGHDVGAKTVTRTLARELRGVALLTRFSRLVADANRPPDHVDLIRTVVGGHRLSFNDHLDPAERERRLATLHRPYHEALDTLLAERRPALLLSVHTFTPVWNRMQRGLDVGVLFDTCEEAARTMADGLSALGLDARLNEPYSGREGLIYAAHRHGTGHGVRHLELEISQGLVARPAQARTFAQRIAPVVAGLLG